MNDDIATFLEALPPEVQKNPHPLRKPCIICEKTQGYIIEKGSQDTVYCANCNTFQYNAPRLETGKPVRSVKTRENIKSALRAKVIIRANRKCELCGKSCEKASLHAGHLLSLEDGKAQGLSEEELTVEENLAAMCDECNLGLGKKTVPLWLVLGIFKARTTKI
jgi:5-methylcytosine-specific restriction endonuclease McrA